MKTTLAILALPFLFAAPLAAQQSDPTGPGQDLIELFEKMHREGATEDDLRKILEDRSRQALLEPEAQHEHENPKIDRPAPEAPRWMIGLVVEPVAPFIREHLGLAKDEGVRVAHVADGSPAARVGIRENDIVFVAGDKKISNLEELKAAVEHAGRAGQPLKLGWIHQGERKGAEITPQEPPRQNREERDERAEREPRAERAPQPPAMMRRMEEMVRRMERQQREIEELRREIEKLKRLQQDEE